jgi:hypothetical protein
MNRAFDRENGLDQAGIAQYCNVNDYKKVAANSSFAIHRSVLVLPPPPAERHPFEPRVPLLCNPPSAVDCRAHRRRKCLQDPSFTTHPHQVEQFNEISDVRF